jgi:hypothetical protein
VTEDTHIFSVLRRPLVRITSQYVNPTPGNKLPLAVAKARGRNIGAREAYWPASVRLGRYRCYLLQVMRDLPNY